MEHKNLWDLFNGATFGRFGGIPLQRLSNTARRQYKKDYSGNEPTPHNDRQSKAAAKRLAFKEKHGYFPGDPRHQGK